MKRVKKFVMEIMERYVDVVESICIWVGKYSKVVGECTVKYGKYLLTRAAVVLVYLFLIVTMPIWYLPYKYFRK